MSFKLAKTCAIVGSVLVAAITRRPKLSGGSTLLVAEELRFHQHIWRRSAIYGDERTVAAPALPMNIARDLFPPVPASPSIAGHSL